MKKIAIVTTLLLALLAIASCDQHDKSDDRQQAQQERILAEGTNAVGMPAIHNFFERRMLKQILELRDQSDLRTYAYVRALDGHLIFLCDSIGYGFPAATQYTNPTKWDHYSNNPYVMAQADPNGLFSPASAEGTWLLCKDPNGEDVKPVYIEDRITVAPFLLDRQAPKGPTP